MSVAFLRPTPWLQSPPLPLSEMQPSFPASCVICPVEVSREKIATAPGAMTFPWLSVPSWEPATAYRYLPSLVMTVLRTPSIPRPCTQPPEPSMVTHPALPGSGVSAPVVVLRE